MKLFDLFQPKWKHSDEQKRKNAIKNLRNDSSLKFVALNDNEECSPLAVEKNQSDRKMAKILLPIRQSFKSRAFED